ncbi:MAG: penicillin-binding protein activator [Gammaproteobacteria bacterium]|nr:penicillin-binding protein activator [Gammaproteobacteria bacterium]
MITSMHASSVRSAALASLALVALAACTPADMMRASSEELAALGEQARTLSTAGDHGAARQVYLSMARRAPPRARQQYQIMAAREAGREGRNRRALSELQTIEPGTEWIGLWSLATAESERMVSGPGAAYERLAAIDPNRFPDVAGDLLRTRSELLFDLQRPAEALQDLTLLGAGFAAGDIESAGLTWSLLRDYRAQLTTDGLEGVALGWIELALLTGELEADPTETRATLQGWRERFPQHPATDLLDDTITPEICRSATHPSRIAMLLPGSERYAAARRSLRDGFLAARYALKSSCAGPEVAFYEVGDPLDAAREWNRAVEEGAEIIVGPLLPESVERVAAIAGERPTLALNRLRAGTPPPRFEEFALAPEHESRQAARHALGRGLRRALVLYPGTEWGRRIYRSFAQEYRDGGGEIIAQEQYSLAAVDYSDQIGRLLKIGASSRRHQELQRRLGRSLGFEPRRRRDADLVFVVARAAQGQLLVPQLRYNYSGDLPIYAIQNVFDPEHLDNRDLNGVEMPALPLLADRHAQVVHGEFSPDWLAASGFNVSLFAMGYDSFKLALSLFDGPQGLGRGIRGLTGIVSRAPDGRLQRELAWTRVEEGKLTAAPATP